MLKKVLHTGPTDVAAVQTGPTFITVTWSPLSPLVGVTGYRILFNVVGSTGFGSVIINNVDTNSYTPMSLTNGMTYRIRIAATSTVLVSEDVYFMANNTVPLGE